MPAVSIGIPAYKGARFLPATIESVLAQSLGDFELVIIDDNSPDDTAEVVRQYADPRIRYLRNAKNLGPEGNFNRCLEEARGRYFKLLPQDDLLMPRCLERQVAILDADTAERIALVFCAREIVRANGRVIMRRGYPGGVREGAMPGERVIRDCIRAGTTLLGEPGAVLLRRSLAEKVGRFDATNPYVIDLDYFVRVLTHGDAYYIDEPLAAFRVWAGSWSVHLGNNQSRHFSAYISRISAGGAHGISAADARRGRVMAYINNVLRLAFYRLLVR